MQRRTGNFREAAGNWHVSYSAGEPRWIYALSTPDDSWLIKERKEKRWSHVGRGRGQPWAGHWIQLWGRRYCHTTQLNIVPNVTRCPGAQNSWPQCGDQHNSLTYLRSLVWCANGNWKPLIRKPKSLGLHLSFDWLMSQTLGVGFAVRLLQSWFIIIINAILECKPWYYKAKVIHLWSVKCQIIFFLKIVIKFGGRHLAKTQGAEPSGKARCCWSAS